MIQKEKNLNNPKYLYRYISLEKKERYENIFKENELYFSSPKDFNDPFDCKMNLSSENCNEEEIKIFTKNIYKSKYPNTNDDELDKLINEGYNECKVTKESFLDQINCAVRKTLQENTEAFRILCLSNLPDDILMWSHYADSHCGIVVQFLKEGLTEYFINCDKVKYGEEFPSIKEWNEYPQNDFHKLFLIRKSEHWGYEEEWRIILEPKSAQYNDSSRHLKFPKKILTGVILGCQISNDNKKRIVDICNDYYPEINVYQAKKDSKSYAINIVNID